MPRLATPPAPRLEAPDFATDGADWPNRDASLFYQSAGHIWHVQRRGSGPVALLLHGAGASSHSWDGLFGLLSNDFDVVAPDLPGHGFTQGAVGFTPTLTHIADALAALLADLDIAPTLVIGHSAGAALAVDMVNRRSLDPEQLVSINGALRPFPGAMGVFAPLAARALVLGGVAPRLMAWSARDRTRVKRLLHDTGSAPPASSVTCYTTLMRRPAHIRGTLNMMANWRLDGIETACRGLSVPALFIAGGRDKAVPPSVSEAMAGLARHGTHVRLDQVGHLAHEEAPEKVADLVRETWT